MRYITIVETFDNNNELVSAKTIPSDDEVVIITKKLYEEILSNLKGSCGAIQDSLAYSKKSLKLINKLESNL